MQPFPNSPKLVRNAFLAPVFGAWRLQLVRHHGLGVAVEAEIWDASRCLVMQLMTRPSCRSTVFAIVESARTIVKNIDLCNSIGQILTCAALTLRWYDIKQLSYCGACLRAGGRRWTWFDPGNFVYSVAWHLLLLHSCSDLRYHSLHRAMRSCMERWPRCYNASFRGHEAIGDLMEMLLSTGYNDNSMMFIVRGLSPIMEHITSLETWIRRHGGYDLTGPPCQTPPANRNPRDMAKILMQSHAWRVRGLSEGASVADPFIRNAISWCYLYSGTTPT